MTNQPSESGRCKFCGRPHDLDEDCVYEDDLDDGLCECGREPGACTFEDNETCHHDKDDGCDCEDRFELDDEPGFLSRQAARYDHDQNYLEGE